MTDSSALPLADLDHLTVGDLTGRIRSLDEPALQALLEYERAHAHRPAVVQAVTTRLDQVRAGQPTSGGDPTAASALAAPAPDAGSPVQPATSGPTQNPPSHGVPTNPAQPRSTG